MNEEEQKHKQSFSVTNNNDNQKSIEQSSPLKSNGEESAQMKINENLIQIIPCQSSTSVNTKIVSSREQQKQIIAEGKQVWNTEGNESRRQHSRKLSRLGQPAQTEKSVDDIQSNSTKATKQKIEYDVVKQYLVKAYTNECVDDGEMELISMPTKRSTTRKKRKKTPIKIEQIYKEEMQKRQISGGFQYTIIDNKKKRQEIKLKQRVVRDFNVDQTDGDSDILNTTQYSSDQIPHNKLHQKSQSFHQQSRNDISQTNLNSSSIQPIEEEPDTIIVEDTYPLEWDPGFNKKARKKLDLINQSRSNNTLPLLDLSNARNLEKYRHVLNRKQGWQPLLNTPFLPISLSNQVTKADLFKNLLKEKKAKLSKSKTPLKQGSRIKGRLVNLQNEWGKYNLDNSNNMSDILNADNVVIQEDKNEHEIQNENGNKLEQGEQAKIEGTINQNQKQSSSSQFVSTSQKINPYKMHHKTNNNHNTINSVISKVTEVNESNLTSGLKTSDQIKLQNTKEFDQIEVINERIDEMMSRIPSQNGYYKQPSQVKQIPRRDIQTANRVRTANQTIGSLSQKRGVRYNSIENQTSSSFYQMQSREKMPKQDLFHPADSQNGVVSRSHDFYNSIIAINQQNQQNFNSNTHKLHPSHSYNTNLSINKINVSNSYSTIVQTQEILTPKLECQSNNNIHINESFSKPQQLDESFSQNQQSITLNEEKLVSFSNNQGNNRNSENIINSQDTVKINQIRPKRQINDKKKVMYISYYDQKMLTEGSLQENPDLQETLKVQEMMIQEQKLKQQLSILRSQGDRASKLDKSFYKDNDEIQDISQRITPVRFDGRKEQRPLSRGNYTSLTPMSSGSKNTHFNTSYNNSNINRQSNNYVINSYNTIGNYHLNNSNININNSISAQNQNTISYNNSSNGFNNLNNYNSINNTIGRTNKHQLSQQYNTISGSQTRTPISVRSVQMQQTMKRVSSKSPINRTTTVKDSLSPHQRIYLQQGNISNQILSAKIQQNNLIPNIQENINVIESKEFLPQQSFSTNMHSTHNNFKYEQELSEEQEAQINNLQQQFDDIIKQNFTKPPKKGNQKQRRYVQQSLI